MTDHGRGTITDAGGPPWEKRGNAAWLRCPRCNTWYPVSPRMLAPDAPKCCCPACHHEFRPAPAPP